LFNNILPEVFVKIEVMNLFATANKKWKCDT